MDFGKKNGGDSSDFDSFDDATAQRERVRRDPFGDHQSPVRANMPARSEADVERHVDSDDASDPARRRAENVKHENSDVDAKPFRGAGPVWTVLMGFIVALFVLIFLLQNNNPVHMDFLWMHNDSVSLSLVTLVVAFVSVAAVELIAFMWRRRQRRILNERQQLRAYRMRESGSQDA